MSQERPSLLSFVLVMVIAVGASVLFTLLIQDGRARHRCQQMGGVVAPLPAGEWECVGANVRTP